MTAGTGFFRPGSGKNHGSELPRGLTAQAVPGVEISWTREDWGRLRAGVREALTRETLPAWTR